MNESTHYHDDGHDHETRSGEISVDLSVDQLAPVDGIPRLTAPHGDGGDPNVPNSGTLSPSPEDEQEPVTVATVVRDQRRMLGAPSGNTGRDDRPHFLRTVEGEEGERCGQCGEDFPCPEYKWIEATSAAAALGMSVEDYLRLNATVPEPEPQTVPLERAAQAVGMSVEEFRAALLELRPDLVKED